MQDPYRLTRWMIQRALAFVYLIAFSIAARQFVPLLGNHGIVPIGPLLRQVPFWNSPSLFYFFSSDFFIQAAAWAGAALSFLALTGFSERCMALSVAVWLSLWALYLSFVNTGQVFYGFGWEMLLLETGFLAIFLGSAKSKTPALVIWLFRWLLFRVMFGAGLIKIRGDECWRDFTCMDYHYETQPLANPLSWLLHKVPGVWHKWEVLSTHLIELVLPFAYFIPGPVCTIAGAVTIFFHGMLILSGNLSWLNYITIVIALACFTGKKAEADIRPIGIFRKIILTGLGGLIGFLSIGPAMNLLSARQMMNASFEPLHLVNTYGAFGSVTRERDEVILEGTDDPFPGPHSFWKEYEFKCKPGDVNRAPCIVSPYHYKIDWQMWFAAMSNWRHHPWMLNFIAKLLQNDARVLSLIEKNPFPENPPQFIRARLYRYRFTTFEEKKETGAWWVRNYLRDYLPPLSLETPSFREALASLGVPL